VGPDLELDVLRCYDKGSIELIAMVMYLSKNAHVAAVMAESVRVAPVCAHDGGEDECGHVISRCVFFNKTAARQYYSSSPYDERQAPRKSMIDVHKVKYAIHM
jgi:hypothetical protein